MDNESNTETQIRHLDDKALRNLGLPVSYSVMYNYVRGRQLEGTYNDDPNIGYWPITSLRVSRGWGMPSEEQWPYVGWHLRKEEPANIDQYAKECRLFAYQRVRSEMECKLALAAGSFVSVALEITDAWFHAKMGKIPLPKEDEKIVGGHCVLLFGYDNNKKMFNLQNSWGKEWGDKGRGYLPYHYIDRLLTEAWIMLPHEDTDKSHKPRTGIVIRWWAIPATLHKALHGVEIRDAQSDEREAWGFASLYDGFINIEELFVRPAYRGKGCFRHLLSHFQELSNRFSVPLRFWVSHADNTSNNMAILRYIANKNNFVVSDSLVRWAAFKIKQAGIPIQEKIPLKIPGIINPSGHLLMGAYMEVNKHEQKAKGS
jgi:GNAT superfamily N-acetyltransferase